MLTDCSVDWRPPEGLQPFHHAEGSDSRSVKEDDHMAGVIVTAKRRVGRVIVAAMRRVIVAAARRVIVAATQRVIVATTGRIIVAAVIPYTNPTTQTANILQ